LLSVKKCATIVIQAKGLDVNTQALPVRYGGNMNKSILKINGEINEVVAVAQPFTHEAPSGFFDGLGEHEMIGVEIGESAGSGLFVASVIFKSENEPTTDNLNTLLEEYSDSKVVLFLETDNNIFVANADGAVAV
jgi:hypothetical protein